jgi:hypothetical protein
MNACARAIRLQNIRAMAKDTSKAIVIIVAMLGVLTGLLLWANHIRPH